MKNIVLIILCHWHTFMMKLTSRKYDKIKVYYVFKILSMFKTSILFFYFHLLRHYTLASF